MNSNIVVNTTWSQTDSNSLNIPTLFTDSGEINYSKSYASGTGPGQVNSVFHEVGVLAASGGTKTYNLTDLSGSLFGNAIPSSFTGVKIFNLKNISTQDADLEVILYSGSGFDAIFGEPTGSIVITPSGMLSRNSYTNPFAVNSSEKFIILQNNSSNACYYDLLIQGNK